MYRMPAKAAYALDERVDVVALDAPQHEPSLGLGFFFYVGPALDGVAARHGTVGDQLRAQAQADETATVATKRAGHP